MRPGIPSHVLRRVSKFVLREFTGSPTGPSSGEKRKKGEEPGRDEKEEREGPREGDRRGRFVPFGSASTSVNAAGLPRTPRRTH